MAQIETTLAAETRKIEVRIVRRLKYLLLLVWLSASLAGVIMCARFANLALENAEETLGASLFSYTPYFVLAILFACSTAVSGWHIGKYLYKNWRTMVD